MPIQVPQWQEFLSCPVCLNEFNEDPRPPVSLGCTHTICRLCLSKLCKQQCPFDQTEVKTPIKSLPINHALLQLVVTDFKCPTRIDVDVEEIIQNHDSFEYARAAMENLALYLLPISSLSSGSGTGKNSLINSINNSSASNGILTRPMQRKLITLVNCQLVEEEGRCRAMRAARSLGERTVKELILLHQNPQHLSANLWAAVRNRGCQFLGPAMQEEVLKLILLALEDGNSLSRKVLVLFVVQRLENTFTQASKTSIGHVVQLLYRASCFKVTKRDGDSSLLQLHEKFRTYSALRKEHDAQIVQIAMEAGLHISPEQWSSLLYGDDEHKSHMQSIIDKLQTPASFSSSIQELIMALQRTQDPADLQRLRVDMERLADIDPSPEGPPPQWMELKDTADSLKFVVDGLVDFVQNYSGKLKGSMESQQTPNSKYKTNMCRDIQMRNSCPRGAQCSFAHTPDELERYRKKRTSGQQIIPVSLNRIGSSSSPETIGVSNGLENGMNKSRDSPDECMRNSPNIQASLSAQNGSEMLPNAYYRPNTGNYINGASPGVNGNHVSTGGAIANGTTIANGAQILNGAVMVSAGQMSNGTHVQNGTHIGNGGHIQNGARMNGAHLANGGQYSNGTHIVNGNQLANGTHLANGGSIKSAAHIVSPPGISAYQRMNYQRPPVIQPDGPAMNSVPTAAYIQSPVLHPSRNMFVNQEYCAPYNQQSFIQSGLAGMPVYANEGSLQVARQYQPYMHPSYISFSGLAAGRGPKDKDENEIGRSTEYKKECSSRSIFPEIGNDDLKLDTSKPSSSSLFGGKSDSIWRDTHDKHRGSSLGSGLDTSSEYSSDTFSPLSIDSCGSPQSSQTNQFSNAWRQFDSQGLNESREFSPQPAMRSQDSFSKIWSQSGDDGASLGLLTQKNWSAYSQEWERRNQPQRYNELLAEKFPEEDERAPLLTSDQRRVPAPIGTKPGGWP